MNHFLKTVLAAGSIAVFSAATVYAQEIPREGPVPTTALIRVDANGNAPITPSTLTLQVNGHNTPIESVEPVAPQNAELAILIDDGLRGSVGLQLNDIADFIKSLPTGVSVLVGYMENGTVRSSSGFTTNHLATSRELRMPFASPGASASPYFCLSDFVKRWPSQQRAARFVLMITNGVDPYNGSTSILNQDSPYVQAAQEDAQRAGVAVYAMYYGDAGMRGARGSFSGQSYLQQVAEATGGESLYNGTMQPISFAPYLKEFRRRLQESYVLGFHASANHERNNTLDSIKVKANQPGIKVHAPEAVHPGTED